MTSLGDDARETLTIVGLEKAKERSLEQHLRLRAPQTWTVLCASVDQYLRTTVDASPTPMEIGAVVSHVVVGRQDMRKKFEVSVAQRQMQQLCDWTYQEDAQTT